MKKKRFILVLIFLILAILLSMSNPQWFAVIKLTDTDGDCSPEYSVKNYSLRVLTPGGWTVYALDDYYGWVRCGRLHGPEVSSPLALSIRPFHSTTPREVEFEQVDGVSKYKIEVEVSFHKPGPVLLEREFHVQ